jgi:hypothetical protein
MTAQQNKDQEIADALSAVSDAFPEAKALGILHDRRSSGARNWSGFEILAPAPRRRRVVTCSHFSSSDELCEDTPCERCGEPFVEWAQ